MTSIAKGSKIKSEGKTLRNEKYIDNTAPIKQIAKDISERERYSKAYKFYNQVLVPRRNGYIETFHYSMPGHPIQTFKENWDGAVAPNFFEPFPYQSTMPKVISEMRNVDMADPVTEYIKMKDLWYTETMTMKTTTLQPKLEYLNDKVAHCPRYLIDLAALLESDPDPNFSSPYNWYYSGNGNMQLICVHWVDYLLHSDLSTVYLTRLNKDEYTLQKGYLACFNCDNDNNILETICSSQNIVALRTKYKIYILRIVNTNETLSFEKLKVFESITPFTSVSFDKYHTNILYTATLDNNLTIVNIDRMAGRSVKLKHHRESLLNNWNCVIGAERGSYINVERNAITIYDKRTNKPTSSWTDLKNIVDMVLCNDITAAKHCEDSPSLYFATDHLVFLMDVRASKKTNCKPVQRWMHGLKSAPTYMSIGKADFNREFIVLSSQWCQDTCVISNYADSVVSSCGSGGLSMPFHPASVTDALREARRAKLCLDVSDPIDARLVTSTTGLLITSQNENSCILTQNSLGDIFLRTLYPSYMDSFIVDNSVRVLSEWSKAYKRKRDDFVVSCVENIAHVWKKLKKLPDSYDFGPKNTKCDYDESKIFEAFENEELNPELLEVWLNEDTEKTLPEQSSLALNLHYETDDDED